MYVLACERGRAGRSEVGLESPQRNAAWLHNSDCDKSGVMYDMMQGRKKVKDGDYVMESERGAGAVQRTEDAELRPTLRRFCIRYLHLHLHLHSFHGFAKTG